MQYKTKLSNYQTIKLAAKLNDIVNCQSDAWKRSNAPYLVRSFTLSLAHSLDTYMYFLQDLIATAICKRKRMVDNVFLNRNL